MKKEKKIKSILFSIWVMIAALLVQSAAAVPFIVKIIMDAFRESGGDMDLYMQIYMEKISSGSWGIISEIIGISLSLLMVGIWFFKGGYAKQYSEEDQAKSKAMMKNPRLMGAVLTGTVAFYGVDALIATLVSYLSPASDAFFETVMDISFGDSIWGMLFAACVLAPFNEEIIFRGIILRRTERSFKSAVPIILIQAILFGIMHLNPLQSAYAVVMGLFLGFIAYKFKSVIPCIIAHAFNNLISTLIGYVPEAWKTNLNFVLLVVVFGLITALLIYINTKKTEKA